jgi:hypothetical protein
LKSISAATIRLLDLKADVSRCKSNMLGVSNPEIEMPYIDIAIDVDTEMIVRNESAAWFAGDDPREL